MSLSFYIQAMRYMLKGKKIYIAKRELFYTKTGRK